MFATLPGGGGKGGEDLGLLTHLVEERTSAPYLTKLPQGLLWRCGWSALHLPGEEASLLLIEFVSNDSIKKGGERLIGWVCIPVESCGEHHLQLRAPPLPKSAEEAKASGGDGEVLPDAWVHCELQVAVTGSMHVRRMYVMCGPNTLCHAGGRIDRQNDR